MAETLEFSERDAAPGRSPKRLMILFGAIVLWSQVASCTSAPVVEAEPLLEAIRYDAGELEPFSRGDSGATQPGTLAIYVYRDLYDDFSPTGDWQAIDSETARELGERLRERALISDFVVLRRDKVRARSGGEEPIAALSVAEQAGARHLLAIRFHRETAHEQDAIITSHPLLPLSFCLYALFPLTYESAAVAIHGLFLDTRGPQLLFETVGLGESRVSYSWTEEQEYSGEGSALGRARATALASFEQGLVEDLRGEP